MARREKLYGGLTRAEQIAAIERAKAGDREAMDAAMRSLMPLIQGRASMWAYHHPLRSVDWYEEGVLHILRKLPLYDPRRISPKTGKTTLPSTFVVFALNRHFRQLLDRELRREDRLQERIDPVDSSTWDSRRTPGVLALVPDHRTVAPDADKFDPMPVRRAVSRLKNPKQRAVIRRRYGLDGEPMTLEAVGVELGVSKERVRKIQRKAEEGLQHALRAFAGGVAV